MSAMDAIKKAADDLFRARSFTDAIEKYGMCIELDPAQASLYSNRAACREKLVKTSHGDVKKEHIAEGLKDGEKCVELDPKFARGYQRLATFLLMAIEEEVENAYSQTDYDNNSHIEEEQLELTREAATLRKSSTAAANVLKLRRQCEAACRSGLGLDLTNQSLRTCLADLRDAFDFELDATLTPSDESLKDAEKAAVCKAAGSAKFGAKDMKGAATDFGSAIAWDPTDAVFFSNRSACRVSTEDFHGAVRDAVKCVALRPEWAKAHNRLATALFGVGDYEQALLLCKKGLEKDPEDASLKALQSKCEKETCESLAVQKQMAKFRNEQRSQKKMNDLLKNFKSAGGGGAQVFNMDQFNLSGGGANPFANIPGLGGGGGGSSAMSEQQMRAMARAMNGGPGATNSVPMTPGTFPGMTGGAPGTFPLPPNAPPGPAFPQAPLRDPSDPDFDDPAVRKAQALVDKWEQDERKGAGSSDPGFSEA